MQPQTMGFLFYTHLIYPEHRIIYNWRTNSLFRVEHSYSTLEITNISSRDGWKVKSLRNLYSFICNYLQVLSGSKVVETRGGRFKQRRTMDKRLDRYEEEKNLERPTMWYRRLPHISIGLGSKTWLQKEITKYDYTEIWISSFKYYCQQGDFAKKPLKRL